MGEQRAVLTGCGAMADGWVKAIKEITELRLVGLTDLRREAAVALAQKHELPAGIVYDSLQAALKATKPDIVFDVTIPSAHYDVTLAALQAGCHVLGEKPLSDTLQRARKMVAAAKKARRTYAVIQNRRYDPNIGTVRQLLSDGKIGRVEEVHGDFYIGAHFGGFRDVMDYPLILDMAIHTFDAARFLSGADPVAVYCHSFNPKHSWYKGDASAIVIFEMNKGVIFSYRGSWCAEGLQTTWETDWRIIGSQGTVRWDGGANIKAQAVKPDGKNGFFSEMMDVPIETVKLDHTGHNAQIREFVRCILQKRKPPTVCDDNIKSLAMVLAAVQSARTGRRIKVKW